MSNLEVYKFDRWFSFGCLFLVVAIVPIISVHEFATTGMIDLDRVSEGRWPLPAWLAYSVGWFCLLLQTVIVFIPAARSILRGYEFIIKGNELVVAGKRLIREEIGTRRRTHFGLVLETNDTKVRFLPWLNSSGIKAIEDFLAADRRVASLKRVADFTS
ncbi:hypothetical protein [Erythrobacter sp. EC-HK427]|uniref:hypothetical protein n=2 Tax=Erythrobacter sp. EC-HK427 TaxID=2038396 RepID=UPI0030DD8180